MSAANHAWRIDALSACTRGATRLASGSPCSIKSSTPAARGRHLPSVPRELRTIAEFRVPVGDAGGTPPTGRRLRSHVEKHDRPELLRDRSFLDRVHRRYHADQTRPAHAGHAYSGGRARRVCGRPTRLRVSCLPGITPLKFSRRKKHLRTLVETGSPLFPRPRYWTNVIDGAKLYPKDETTRDRADRQRGRRRRRGDGRARPDERLHRARAPRLASRRP